MTDKENLAESYLKKLREETNPVVLLVKFYADLFTLPFNTDLIGPISRLVQVYGRENVFFSILAIENMDNLSHDNIYPLLRFMCNKKLETKVNPNLPEDLTKYSIEMSIKTEKTLKHKMKVRDPFED